MFNNRIKRLYFSFVLLVLSVSLISAQGFYDQLSDAALELTKQQVVYDPGYYVIDYPGGDIPEGRGVCTDVIVRAYRTLGLDLQELVHKDMQANFAKYPQNWGLNYPDKNIDHRRVPNLMKFFERQNASLEITDTAEDYLPGDIVCWNLGGGITHIGIVVNRKTTDYQRYLIVHNIGEGQNLEDCLFKFKIIGHYRFSGSGF